MQAVNAVQMAAGRLVVADIDGVPTVCLKAERQGRDFLNHYLVPLDPLPAGRGLLRLRYVDPETPVIPCAGRLVCDEPTAMAAEIGDVVVNGRGRFLKVFDTARTERHFAYVEMASGEVRMRQERNVTGAAMWRLER